jgi:hypothetical protein
MVAEHQHHDPSVTAAAQAVAKQSGAGREKVRRWYVYVINPELESPTRTRPRRRRYCPEDCPSASTPRRHASTGESGDWSSEDHVPRILVGGCGPIVWPAIWQSRCTCSVDRSLTRVHMHFGNASPFVRASRSGAR